MLGALVVLAWCLGCARFDSCSCAGCGNYRGLLVLVRLLMAQELDYLDVSNAIGHISLNEVVLIEPAQESLDIEAFAVWEGLGLDPQRPILEPPLPVGHHPEPFK